MVEHKSFGKKIKDFYMRYGIVLMILILSAIFTILKPAFLGPDNLLNVVRQASVLIIVACGCTFVMIAGDIDVSVGAIACLTGMIAAKAMTNGIPILLSCLLGILVGSALGVVKGFLVTRFDLPPMVVTLAVQYFASGVANIMTGGTAIYDLPEAFDFLGRGHIWVFPTQVVLMAVFVVFFSLLLSKTAFGRRTYAIGGNQEVAKLAGIHVSRYRITFYIIASICASCGGLIMTSRVASGQPTLGTMWPMEVITSIALGGTSLKGGRGSVVGSMFGMFLLTIITNGLNINGVNSFWQMVATSVILIFTIIMNRND